MSRRSTGLLANRSLERRVPLRGKLTNQLAACCIARLLVLATEDRHKPIITYIDSPSGMASEALGIISTMNGIRSPVVTFCRGPVGLGATVIAAHGLKGFRSAAATAVFSLELQDEAAREDGVQPHESYVKLLAQALADDTGKAQAEVLEWFESGRQFSAQEALSHGLIDVIGSEPVLPKAG
jgi:ATP-dependent Clp endopeptidase proteolytic subunit ClpP